MLLGGDEIGRTQGGNNNAYCQDNEISWFDWERRRRPAGVTRRLIALRADAPTFRRRAWFRGCDIRSPDIAWLKPDGTEMDDEGWNQGPRAGSTATASASGPPGCDRRRRLPAVLNASGDRLDWKLPDTIGDGREVVSAPPPAASRRAGAGCGRSGGSAPTLLLRRGECRHERGPTFGSTDLALAP